MRSPARPEQQRLNLGCGRDIRPGYVNLDAADLPGVDVVHDAERLPLPFEDESFEEVLCNSILEHLDFIPVLRDLHRILRPGGRLIVTGPHFTTRNVFVDPTHKTAFSVDTFRFFVHEDEFAERDYYFDFHFSRVESAEILFIRTHVELWNYLVQPLVNRSAAMQRFYEATFLSRLFPASEIRVALVK
jgi:SAM-dependent methyltransferase